LKGSQDAFLGDAMAGKAVDFLPIKLNLSSIRFEDPGNNIKKGRFAGSIGSNETGNGSFRNAKGAAVQGLNPTKTFFNLNDI
jgi:hypothetical protein